MLIGRQVGKRERKGGTEGWREGCGREGETEGETYSFPLDGSIFCHGFRIRCRTDH